jgi:uncharacterized membrane protein (UPF0127 family)
MNNISDINNKIKNINKQKKNKNNKYRERKKEKKGYNEKNNINSIFIIIIIMISFFIVMYIYKNYYSSEEGYKNNKNNNKRNLKIVLELVKATNYEDIQRGLMFRKVPLHERQQEYNYHSQTQINDKKKLKEYHHLIKFKQGMLFDYGKNRIISMWMKNTFIPLDIIFLDNDYKVINYHKNATPHSLEGLSSKKEAYYAIELNAGSIDDLNIGVGDNIKEWIKIIDELD